MSLLSAVLVACSSQRPNKTDAAPPSTSVPVPTRDAGASIEKEPIPTALEETSREPTFDEITSILFSDRANPSAVGAVGATCPPSIPPDARVRCLFDERYRGDSKAASLAHELFVKWRVIAGVETAHTMDGGYRGMIRIEPAVPIAAERRHLEWVSRAMDDFDAFFAGLERHAAKRGAGDAGAHGAGNVANRYRFKPITLRFMRSVAARTPSAYAHDWTVAWNLAGSLHTSFDAARETLFHEIFHLNDFAHSPPGTEAWSFAALGMTFDAIVKKCGTSIPCLGPYTPNDTVVRGGTYYSFQPGNGVREYAAELALRYYREQRAALASESGAAPKVKAFKCGPPENARAWALMRDEFFGGMDAVPPCS